MLRPTEPLAERRWIPGFVLAFGFASVILLLASDRIRQRSAIEDAHSLLACERIRVDLAISHLWLEEHVSGDIVEVAEIEARLDNAIDHLDQMAGATVRESDPASVFTSPPLHDAELRRRAASLRPRVENFRTLSTERLQGFAQDLQVGIGSPLDLEYDKVFTDLLAATKQLELDLLAHHRQHRSQAQRLFFTIVLVWSLFVALAALGLWVRQRRQKKTELDLQASQAQLTHSQRMDAAGRLAGGLAHDLSNYLAAIRGHCELTRLKAPAGPRLAEKMDEVIHTVDRASDLVDRLLAFGRRQPMHPTAVAVEPLLNDVAAMLAPSMGDKVHLRVHSAPDPWSIHVDRTGLEQALVNLLVNARDAMPDGGTVQIKARNRRGNEHRRDEVEISVGDHGDGIAAENLEQIFDPFWTTKRSSGGSGLGLSVVYSFVEQSGGRLSVDSIVGRGTTFSLFFPRHPSSSAPGDGASPAAPEPPPVAPSREPPPEIPHPAVDDSAWSNDDSLQELAEGDLEGHECLLLVDDNEVLRRSTQEVLEALGYDVLAAANGEQALALDRRRQIDLFILDLVLPDMHGGQLLRELRRQGEGREVPTILISGHHAQDLDLSTLDIEAGAAVHFVAKSQLSAFRLAQYIRQQLDTGSRP